MAVSMFAVVAICVFVRVFSGAIARHAVRWQSDEQLTVFDALQAQQPIGKLAHSSSLTAQQNNFHTIVVVNVNVRYRNNKVVAIML